jgi:lipooligosaccharide transport system permease protein
MNPFPESMSWRWIRVWQRNWSVYMRTLPIRFLTPILEPILYILAFGFGLGSFVGEIPYRGQEISYIAFIVPGLIAISIMFNAFFENTYASFVRMYYQKTFDAMLATPLVIEEVITAEIVWGTTLSLMSTVVMMGVVTVLGLLRYPHAFLIIPIAVVGGLAFSSIAMCFTALLKSIDMFNLPTFLFVTPMFLFSGTFFPLESLPKWAQSAALVLPLTHLVTVVRSLGRGYWEPRLLWSILYLAVFSLIFYFLALMLMRHRLIK